jgi:iron complex outermembrane recepter protein
MLKLAAFAAHSRTTRRFQLGAVGRAFALLCFAALSLHSAAQNPSPAGPAPSQNQPTQDQSMPQAPKPQPAAQTIPPVTTTVVVHGEVKNEYSPPDIEIGNLAGQFTSVQETPLSISVASRAVLDDQGARVLSDVVKNDASIGEDYAPVGYYGDFEIRGFPIDLATGLGINGMTIAGEQDVPLENKERVEFLKGIAGVESGVASAGGLINYVTKPALTVRAIDLATDHRGTTYGALDIGQLFGKGNGSGLRFNFAGENMHPYVESTNGWRGVGAGRGDWKLDSATFLKTDFEYQHRIQRSVAGYQLLGGSVVPAHMSPDVMLGDQYWSKPNTFDVFNAGARLDRKLGRAQAADWHAYLAGSYSHSLIDDNVIWPYGAALDANGNSLCPNSPIYFFCPDGSYEIYDYRSPEELRIDAVGEALIDGTVRTGAIANHLVAGGSILHRMVDLSPTIVDTALGVENIYQPNIAYAPENPYQHPSPSVLADYDHQNSGMVQDRAELPGGVALIAGGRYARVSDFNYTQPRSLWLPQYAATYTPQWPRGAAHPLTLYGNYGSLLSLGPQAPWWVDNANLYLDPFITRQAEAGAKYDRGMLFTADVFRMREPFFYPKVIAKADSFCSSNLLTGGSVQPGDLCFEAGGHETHDGLEASAAGKAASWLQLTASAAATRGISSDTGTPAFDNRQVINLPHVRTTLFADVLVRHARGLHLMPGWSYTSRKEATRDDRVSVGSYNLFNLGARYTPGGENGRVTLRLYADNILDKRYWKDTGASYGDTFIHLGAPTTVRLSAHYTF